MHIGGGGVSNYHGVDFRSCHGEYLLPVRVDRRAGHKLGWLVPGILQHRQSQSFSNVRGLLAADAAANTSNRILSTAVASLPISTTALRGRPYLYMTAANLRALGLSASYCYNAAGSYVG